VSGEGEIALRHGDLAVRLRSLGGAILSATYRGTPFLVAGGGTDGAMASFPLVPFGNRVESNIMCFHGRDYRFQPNSADQFYLHGDGWLGSWEIEHAEQHRVLFSFSRVADATSPYSYAARQEVALVDGALVLTLSVENRGDEALPFGLGQHPFFLRTPKTRLTTVAESFWSERAGYLPDTSGPVPELFDFRAGAALPDVWANNAFGGWNGVAEIVWPESGMQARLEADAIFGTFMLYMPVERTDFFCLEPMSHLPNGHHLPEFGGLTALTPGESLSGTVKIRLSHIQGELG
jgi:aldose 1-epimerase